MIKRLLLFQLGLAWISQSLAAPGDPHSSPNPPAVQRMTLDYESAFSDYKPYIEEKISSWRALNEKVRGGGHSGHSLGSQNSMGNMESESGGMPLDNSKPAAGPDQPFESEHQHHHMD